MEYISVKDFALKYNLSEGTVRDYCLRGKIAGAKKEGRAWRIPASATLSLPGKSRNVSPLLARLLAEKAGGIKGGIYHHVQVELTYNSNHIEGSRLTHDQTRYIFETNTVGVDTKAIRVDDIIETANHFRCIDFIIDHAQSPLSEAMIKELHRILKTATGDARKSWFPVGDYKRLPNEVGGMETTLPEDVHNQMAALLKGYNKAKHHTLEEIIDFHYQFEAIHPFQDGNGRVGRLIMFKECLAEGIVPFVITEELKMFYYRGLREWRRVRGYLLDTCLSAQDDFKALLDYFRIEHTTE